MRPQLIFTLALVFAILQITIMENFRFFGIKPDLLLIVIFLGGLFLGQRKALGLGISAGLFKDVFSLNTYGLNTVLFPLWIFLIRKFIRRVSIEDNLSRAILIALVALFNDIVSGFILIYAGASIPPFIFLRTIILSSIYTALIFYSIIRLTVK